MLKYSWNENKDKHLKQTRNISFDQILKALRSNKNTISIPNPNQSKFQGQHIYIVFINDYAYAVPYIKHKQEIFLKTVYPSRKYQKQYNKKGEI